jgi:hypothetical protein
MVRSAASDGAPRRGAPWGPSPSCARSPSSRVPRVRISAPGAGRQPLPDRVGGTRSFLVRRGRLARGAAFGPGWWVQPPSPTGPGRRGPWNAACRHHRWLGPPIGGPGDDSRPCRWPIPTARSRDRWPHPPTTTVPGPDGHRRTASGTDRWLDPPPPWDRADSGRPERRPWPPPASCAERAGGRCPGVAEGRAARVAAEGPVSPPQRPLRRAARRRPSRPTRRPGRCRRPPPPA